jgi:PAS domain S-box-containing protein
MTIGHPLVPVEPDAPAHRRAAEPATAPSPAESRHDPGNVVQIGGRIVQADRAAGKLLGFADRTELLGRLVADLASTSSRTAARQRMTPPPAGDDRRTQLLDMERVDGSEISVEVATEGVDWNGRAAEHVTLTLAPDLSARLRRLVTGVLGDVADAVIITDLHFHLLSWNAAAERLYGWGEAEVLGRHVLDIIRWADDGGALNEIWNGLTTSGQWKGQSAQFTHDGAPIDVLTTTTVIHDADEPILIVSVNRIAPATVSELDPEHLAAVPPDLLRRADREIRDAIVNDEFVVHFQPVVSLQNMRIVTMEALVRWDHPTRGLLSPSAIIATAELHGSILDLGNVVLEKACTQAAAWRASGADIDVSVNLSARQLSDPDLHHRITKVLEQTGLAPHHLWLEVTETALVEEVGRATAVLDRLAAIGVRFAIDDFGTGWASLTYLQRFPIHELKIDRSFVAGVGHNANDTAIARSIIALGAELDLVVIAEGIETVEQMTALQGLGCAYGQGYLFGHPAPADAHAAVIEGARRLVLG